MKSFSLPNIGLRLVVFQLGLLLGQTGWAAVGFTVTPAAVSNTYSGAITLQVTGLTNTETVVVQKFLDANTNGVIDAGDILGQQFQLTDGLASVFHDGATAVTNINIPGDTDSTAGQITAQLSIQGDFSQSIVGKYLYKLFSPSGHFTPITNLFSVTNFPHAQQFTGNVVNNGTNVPNAIVLLFPPPSSSGGGGSPQAGAVANNTGSYTIKAAAGTYSLVAFKTNYLADISAAPNLTLGGGATITTNLSLISATQSISGKIVDANTPSVGLPGLLVPVTSTNNLIAVTFGDTNGNFTARVTASYWKIERNESSLAVYGYLSTQNKTKVDTSTGSVSGVTIALPKATAIFYGSVKDNLNHPLAGISLFANDGIGQYESGATTDANGNYIAGALGGGTWSVQIDNNQSSGLANYIFSQGLNGNGTNISAGQAVPQNFTALLATNHISGYVKDNSSNPIAGVQVNANANINGANYQAQADTDSNGNYSLNVANGNWGVSVCCGCNNCGNCLSTAYQCPNSQNVNIANNNATVDFTVQLCNGIQITTTSLPSGDVGSYYDTFLDASSCNGNLTWSLNDPQNFPSSLGFGSNGEIQGTPATAGTYNFSVHVSDGSHSTNQALSLTIHPPLQVTTSSLPNGTNGVYYSAQLNASGGQTPYSWSLASGSPQLPMMLSLSANGSITGTANTTGTFGFTVQVIDGTFQHVAYSNLSLTIVGASAPLRVTTTSLPTGTNGAFYSQTLHASGGTTPYSWFIPNYSADPPANLILGTNGVLSGTLVTNGGPFYFDVAVTDGAASNAYQTLSLYIVNPPLPPLVITNVSFPSGTVGAPYSAQLGATGGEPPYTWSLAIGSASLPSGLSLNSAGRISGTPTTNKVFPFKVQATDANFTTTNKVLSITINPKPVLGSPFWLANQFQMRLSGVTGQNYTVQVSTNLSPTNWTLLFVTNSTTTNSFIVTDRNATNGQRFYRALVGP